MHLVYVKCVGCCMLNKTQKFLYVNIHVQMKEYPSTILVSSEDKPIWIAFLAPI